MFSDKDENDDSPGGIDGEELYALMYRARGTPALRRARRALLGVRDKKGKPPPMIDQALVLRAVRQLDPTSRSGSRPILNERAFTSYMLNAFKQGAGKRRQIFERDEVVVWMCAVLEFIKDTALQGMLSTERSDGGGNACDPMTALALSSMVTEFDRDEDDQLNLHEFRKMVRSATKKSGFCLEAEDEMALGDFLGCFDTDGDGSVSNREFVEYMSSLMKLDRAAIVAQGEFGMLQSYVIAAAALRARFLKYAVTELSTLVKAVRSTGSQAADGNGCISPSQLCRLVQNCELSLEAANLKDILPCLHKKKKSEVDANGDGEEMDAGMFRARDAEKLLAYMDKNGDGELDTGEFVECLLRSLVQSKKSTRSALKKAKCSKALEGMITVLRLETQRRVLVEASRMLFQRFDVGNEGEVDVNGLAQIILGCAKEHSIAPPWELKSESGWKDEYAQNVEKSLPWVTPLFDKMDANKDGSLSSEEFCLFLGATLMRERFSSKEDELRSPEQEKLFEVISILDAELPMLA